MHSKFDISISKPCSEKFSQFTPTQAGGFCNSCQKEVIDFTKMSDQEIIDFFKNQSQNTCGRFSKSQLKTYAVLPSVTRKRGFNWLGAGLMSLSFFAFISPSQAQSAKAPNTHVSPQKSDAKTKKEQAKHEKDTLTGYVYDDGGEPLPAVTVTIKGSTQGTLTDVNGKYTIRNLKEGDILIFGYIGFEYKEVVYSNKLMGQKIVLHEAYDLLGEVNVQQAYSAKRSLWQRFKNLFRKNNG